MYTLSAAVQARADKSYLGDVVTPDGRVLTRYNSSHELRSYYRHRDRIRAQQREYRERMRTTKRRAVRVSTAVQGLLCKPWDRYTRRRMQNRRNYARWRERHLEEARTYCRVYYRAYRARKRGKPKLRLAA